MDTCSYQKDLERWFDGEVADSRAIEEHLAACTACSAHLEKLRQVRSAVGAMNVTSEITDAQLGSFLNELETKVHAPKTRHVGLWAMASAAAAALVVSASVLSIFSTGPQPIQAQTVVEEFSTEIDGATTESFYSDDGTATVWINLPEGEML